MTPDRDDDGNDGDAGDDPARGSGDSENGTPSTPGADDPFEDLADVGIDADADADADVENPFERLPADADEADDPFERVEADLAPEVEGEASGGDEAIIPKNRYCESCEHFSDPPEVRCTHPGTEIRELVDMEHFRVFDCPVVADRRELAEVVAAGADAAIDDVIDTDD